MSRLDRVATLVGELATVLDSYQDLSASERASALFAGWVELLELQSSDDAIRVFATYLNEMQRTGVLLK